MTKTPYSSCIIAPQAEWDAIRKFLASQGYDLGDGIPMSLDGREPATYRGAHMWLTEEQAKIFTLREEPKNFAGKYTLAEAQACLETFKSRADDVNINHGAAPEAIRKARLSVNTDGAMPTKREHFDAVASDVGVKFVEVTEEIERKII